MVIKISASHPALPAYSRHISCRITDNAVNETHYSGLRRQFSASLTPATHKVDGIEIRCRPVHPAWGDSYQERIKGAW